MANSYRIQVLLGLLLLVPNAAVVAQSESYLSVGRSMGFRPAEFITVQSDYQFTLNKDRTWKYQSYNPSERKEYVRTGELPISIELLEQKLEEFGINEIPEPDPNAPKIADLPTLALRREMDGEPWTRELRPSSKEGMRIHYLIQFIVTGVQELDAAHYSLGDKDPRGVDKPIEIADEQTLETVFGDGGDFAKLHDSVDFKERKMVVFHWAGSGQDDLFAFIDDEEDKLVFAYRGGMTRDLRQHARIFILPKEMEWEQKKLPAPRLR